MLSHLSAKELLARLRSPEREVLRRRRRDIEAEKRRWRPRRLMFHHETEAAIKRCLFAELEPVLDELPDEIRLRPVIQLLEMRCRNAACGEIVSLREIVGLREHSQMAIEELDEVRRLLDGYNEAHVELQMWLLELEEQQIDLEFRQLMNDKEIQELTAQLPPLPTTSD